MARATARSASRRSFDRAFASVRVLRNPGNRGKGYAVRHGMLEAKGEWTLFTDADLSTPIEELEKLWTAAQEAGAQVAIGSRALDRSLIGVHQPLFRESAGKLFNLTVRVITGLPFRDTQCGFKLFETSAAREIFRRQQLERFGFDVEVLFIARKLGYSSIEVPVRWNDVAGTKVGARERALGIPRSLARAVESVERKVCRGENTADSDVLSSYNHFAQLFLRQEKFH